MMTIKNGSVGVNQTNPNAILHVSQTGSLPAIFVEGGSSTEGDLAVNDGEHLQTGHWDGSTFTERFRIGSSGQLGVAGANYGSSGQVLTSGGSSAAPSWGGGAIPVGGIIMWSGSISNIPSGWALCNGSNGTPDLRNRFVVGAYSDSANSAWPNLAPDDTGGSANAVVVSHDHDADASSNVSDPGHRHSSRGFGTDDDGGDQHTGSGNNSVRNNAIEDATTGINVSTNIDIDNEGESGTGKYLPPYYALAYIMKT